MNSSPQTERRVESSLQEGTDIAMGRDSPGNSATAGRRREKGRPKSAARIHATSTSQSWRASGAMFFCPVCLEEAAPNRSATRLTRCGRRLASYHSVRKNASFFWRPGRLPSCLTEIRRNNVGRRGFEQEGTEEAECAENLRFLCVLLFKIFPAVSGWWERPAENPNVPMGLLLRAGP
jgi:hypothetical protein